MLRALALAISLSLMNFFQVATPPALAGDTLIKCKIKGVGIRNFKLEDGIWSDKVWSVRIIRAERMVSRNRQAEYESRWRRDVLHGCGYKTSRYVDMGPHHYQFR